MPTDFEQARSNLDELIGWAEKNAPTEQRNEAATRLHLIDRLLFDCLGWPREEAFPEERVDGQYSDYSLGVPVRRLLVEAKKEGIYFELPAGLDRDTYALKTLFDGNKDIEGAVRQAIDYCQSGGIPIGSVSNGHQIIAFIGSRLDGVPPLEGRALVFSSLEDMQARFRAFWDNLSKPGIEALSIYRVLKSEASPPPPEKLSQRIIGYPGYKGRNQLQTELQILGGLFIEDIARAPEVEEDFLRQCYSPSGALSQYALVSKEILKTRYSLLFQQETEVYAQPAQDKRGVAKELSSDVFAASLSRRPVILLGDVGVGKTIFIRNLISVEAKEIFDRALVLYIDFGTEPALADELSRYVVDEFGRQLRERYDIDIEERQFVRGVYHSELQRFGKSVYADLRSVDEQAYKREELAFLMRKVEDREEHLKACLLHASKAQGRQVVVFLDNVDQRPFEFQEQVFLIAQSMAENWPGTFFVSLRPDTFYRSRSVGSLTAYQPRVFTIAPPRVDVVISKRLRFAQEQLKGTGRLPTLPAGLTVQSDRLSDYLDVLLESFDKNSDLVEFIDNLSAGNVRRALDFVGAFVGSGHVNTQKILDAKAKTGGYVIPLHEFMRAVVYGDYEYYEPSASPIANLFDISTPDGREHFLLPVILAFVERAGKNGGEEGYVLLSSVQEYVQQLGFHPQQVEEALNRAYRKQLLEVSPKYAHGSSAARCRITTVGAYTFRRLPAFFVYVDAVVVDTPIVDERWAVHIGDVKPITERLRRAEYFRTYLDKQ